MYNIYPSILDTFQSYLYCEETYQRYWGGNENPSKTEDEFEKECFKGLIDKINRVPFESDAADKGTAYNELLDCIIDKRISDKISIERVNLQEKTIGFNVTYKEKTNLFQYNTLMFLKDYLKYAIPQELVEGIINTDRGDVRLYGYLDYRLPDKIVDLKTTSTNYSAGKYIDNLQHLLYTYCVRQKGILLNDFTYLIVQFSKDRENIFIEDYIYESDRDENILRDICSHFIDFIETNKHLITDKKIFGL